MNLPPVFYIFYDDLHRESDLDGWDILPLDGHNEYHNTLIADKYNILFRLL